MINKDPRNTFKVKTNKFSDWSDEEFAAKLLGARIDPSEEETQVLAQTDVFAEAMAGCSCPKYTCRYSYCQQCYDYGKGKSPTLQDWRTYGTNPPAD